MWSDLHKQLAGPGHPGRDKRIVWEAAKTRVLSVLMERAKRTDEGLTNEEIRRITHLDRFQVHRLMGELTQEGKKVKIVGQKRWTRYVFRS